MFSQSNLDGSAKKPYCCFKCFRYCWISYSALSFQKLSRPFDQASSFFLFRLASRCADLLDLLLVLVPVHGLHGPGEFDSTSWSCCWSLDRSCCWKWTWSCCCCSAGVSSLQYWLPSDEMYSSDCLAASSMLWLTFSSNFFSFERSSFFVLYHLLWASAPGFWCRPKLLSAPE